MGSLRILLLFGCISLNVVTQASTTDNWDEKLKQTKIEIAKVYFQKEPLVERKIYNVKWNKLWQQTRNEEGTFVLNAFDKILFIEGDHVTAFSTNAPPSNQSSQEVTLTHSHGPIKFVRSIVWKTILYLLVCHETRSCTLYTGTDDLQLRHRQTIQQSGQPMDASFFTRTNRLYLVVANNWGQFAVPSLIYHWRGTYMDAVEEVMTTAAISVITFKHKQSTIIVFVQNDRNVPGIGSMVYEFKETSLDRIQFLSTFDPASVYHYDHTGFSFILLINERGPSSLFWWDGQELLSWQQVTEIQAKSLVHVVSVNEDTFFFVGHNDTLQLYKFENASDCTLLNSTKLSDGEIVVDLQARVDKSTVILVLVTMKDKIYGVEAWEWQIKEMLSGHSKEEPDVLSKHLSQLVEILRRRKPFVEKAEASWPSLLPADEDLTISEPLTLPTLLLDSGTLGNIDVFAVEDVVTPRELQENLDTLRSEVDDVLKGSRNLLKSLNDLHSLKGDIVIQGDAFVEKLQIDKMDVDFLNDIDIQSRDGIDNDQAENFLVPLRGKDVIIENLEVDSLCGIPVQYWALKNDTSKMEINLELSKIEFSNNTIHLLSNVSLPRLNTETLNNIQVDKFLSELFIIGRNQRMKGNITYKNELQVLNLTLNTLNEEPWESYMTTNTNQSFNKFSIKTLNIDHLYAETINGIPVSEAARISRENVIKGEVKIAKLHVTDEFIVNSKFKIPEGKPLQIYYNLTIAGNLKLKILDLDKKTKVYLDHEEINLNNILEIFWTKSTDQVITNNVTFENSLTIDHLRVKYLNGIPEEDYLYTTVTEIPEKFTNLHFENIDIDDMFLVDGGSDSFFDVAPESLTIREKLHLKELRGNMLVTNTFNGLFVPDLVSGKPLSFSENMDFPEIQAKRVNVEELNFLFINGEDSVTFLKNRRNVHQNQRSDFMKTPEFQAENIMVERINDVDMKSLESLREINIADLKDLVIDGDLTVKGDLKVEKIDSQHPETYLENMANKDIVLDTEIEIDELIVQNATFKFVNNRDANQLFEGLLSKSRDQFIPGQFSFYKITTDNIAAKFINHKDTSKLQWIEEPLFFDGDVIFHDLSAMDVETETLNDRNVNELYESLLDVPVTKINDLKVEGTVFWNVSSSNSTSLSSLFENAVTKNTDQVISGNIIFENDVSMSTVEGNWKEVEDIRKVVNDAVIEDEGVIEVTGEKVFKKNVAINTLSVNDMQVPIINDVNVIEFNNSVARKDQDETINGSITFLEEVAINELLVNDTVHDVPLDGLVLATDMLPPNVSFKHLVVLRDVYLKNLDGVEFNKFLEERITTNGNHDIDADVQFNGVVEVTGDATVERLNGINPSDLVLDGVQGVQVISGVKTFEEDVVVNGNVHASLINGVNISSEYLNGVQKDEDAKIIGDLIFESNVEIPENVTIWGMVNEINLNTILDELGDETNQTLRMFTRNETKLDESLEQSSLISQTLRNIFSYLEVEEQVKIQVPNIKKVDVVYFEEVTKLNMFGEEPGPSCGLPQNCPCPTEYVAELTKHDCRVWRSNGSTILRNYHELHGTFGINVITNVVSSSHECTLNENEHGFTTISWMKHGLIETGDVLADVKESFKIRGYVKDAEVFMTYDNAVYVVLAIYYDPLNQTHLTNSVVYKIDFEKNLLSLNQNLFTDGASEIEIFKTNHKVYLLIGCFGESEKSYLYKLDATSKFKVLRTFGGKTRNVKSLLQEKERFILLDDFDTNAVNIFRYDPQFENFFDYQTLIHDSKINGIECFYADEFGHSDSFIIVTTEDDRFYIYEYMFAQKFQLRVRHQIDDLQAMVPFHYLGNLYIFTGTNTNSTILRIVRQGPR
ncbi:uncharacterized protein LOC143185740 [Calliopsis andreniformis]|uniref:uncharacterized protein LOC143185740 n=1 Tax=Calliopsis andreniformis TaxID=337506 RepID=UPI003FCD7C43